MRSNKNQAINPLLNKTILVTRPIRREVKLRQLIEGLGGGIIHYPVFTITTPTPEQIKPLLLLQKQLHNFSMAIFISPTAVEQSQPYFPVLPKHLIIASIGSKTTQALIDRNIKVDIEAPDHNTESILQSDDFQKDAIKGKHILIFRGVGGRELLGETLIKRGAYINYVETYQRLLPSSPPLNTATLKTLNAITISSDNGLKNLITLMKGAKFLPHIPIIVPARRTHDYALQQGFNTIITAKNATDEAIIKALTVCLSDSS
ncbi:MAG: uroporphyrinogen-III synthase [Gammaproteobacteria bacterium]|nr:uroporphyrinogen-III synthase [Gammaproteobacteria bacterium]